MKRAGSASRASTLAVCLGYALGALATWSASAQDAPAAPLGAATQDAPAAPLGAATQDAPAAPLGAATQGAPEAASGASSRGTPDAPLSASAQGAPGSCAREVAAPAEQASRFLVLAASRGIFHNGSGPAFVMLMKSGAAAAEAEMGAVGIYADEKGRAAFGAVPWQVYDTFLHEPERGSQSVLLRLQISEPQYDRILAVLHAWDRRAREDQLLYPDNLYMNNILLVKQATEELNRCRHAANLYKLDWGIDDLISDNNASSRVPFLVFEELKRRNEALHVPDRSMPQGLVLLAGTEPLPAREPDASMQTLVRDPAPAHEHHMHDHMHMHAPAEAAH